MTSITTTKEKIALRPILRWAGSKKQLLPSIAEYWSPDFQRYVEPFCGSASLFFNIQPAAAILSDLNTDLINALHQIQVNAGKVSECLSRLPSSADDYYAIRTQDPATLSPNESAARFIYLNQHCFNGLYRVNKSGKFNVPFGRSKRTNRISSEELRLASRLLSTATIKCSDFQDVIDSCTDGDFIYLDPPYASSVHRNTFIEYGIDGFSEMDIGRLFESLGLASKRGAKFVLSYADVPDLAPYCKKYHVRVVEVRRNIAGFTGSRRKVSELLITNCEVRDV